MLLKRSGSVQIKGSLLPLHNRHTPVLLLRSSSSSSSYSTAALLKTETSLNNHHHYIHSRNIGSLIPKRLYSSGLNHNEPKVLTVETARSHGLKVLR